MTAETAQVDAQEYEALLQFLYMAPVGLVQLAADGAILMLNPLSAQLLMPLSRDGSLTNLFDALEPVAPDLRLLCADYAADTGQVCDATRLYLHADDAGSGPQVLSLSMLKLDSSRLMAVLSDVSEQDRRERQLRQSDAWLNALLTNISDYALVGLDRRGNVERLEPRRNGCSSTACAKPTPTAGAWTKARACAPTAASSGAAP
jgi:hypothetical protein